jgi:hypothetical protein
MYEYFVEKGVNDKGEHVVHKDCCPSLPAKEKLLFIGVRSTTRVPLEEAANFYSSRSAPCPECMVS